ncbi:DciA family protein [Granulosicoccus antarcticus]|uniref:DUF721 domain-containing protein n=1 Tax=Granulosicoccus antarcticus IMCC3135 TaxID=1192854 RepID=A0A2Z2P3A2_9GAMM|nr:DciA family protein [Granulosicoccus antarcticus]ASJ75880.1 hypothetical protein IMCC3135_29145 [Granulosicoccus antarcticus IMCC3135]
MKSFSNLIDRATRTAMQQDRHIREVISRIVPATTLAHIQFFRIEGGRMRVTVDNAGWITKLRFSERQILDAMRDQKLDVITMSFHVMPAEIPVARTTHRTANPTSSNAARCIALLAASADDQMGEPAAPAYRANLSPRKSIVRQGDDRLRQELLKLAARLKEEK